MTSKKDWFIAIAMSFGMIGAAHSAVYLKLDGIKGEATSQPATPAGDLTQKPAKPQKGLLLPAVQKASDETPDTPPPSQRSKSRVAAGDIDGDGRANAEMKKAKLHVRKDSVSEEPYRGQSGQIRTNE